GFVAQKVEGLPPKRQCLKGIYAPAWEPKGLRPLNAIQSGHCVVVGGGLAGASVAASLARRGWQVTVLDADAKPAAGASGLPVSPGSRAAACAPLSSKHAHCCPKARSGRPPACSNIVSVRQWRHWKYRKR
ncbi:MAG: mnmC, partial [Ramlibacter sp.]|nr:mnmC [Ramlibacter sp.]